MQVTFNPMSAPNFGAKVDKRILKSATQYAVTPEEQLKLKNSLKTIKELAPNVQIKLEEHTRANSKYGCATLGGGFADIKLIPPQSTNREDIYIGNVSYTDTDDSYEDELAKKSYFLLTSRSLRSRLCFFDGLK
jgi:hypothetical protein